MAVFILKDYRSLKKKDFATLLTSITNGFYVYVLVFLLPPVAMADFTAAVAVYTKANTDYEAGGKGFKTPYVTARNVILAMLDKLHASVIAMPGLNAEIALQSGFNLNPAAVIIALIQATLRKITRLGGNAIKVEYNVVKGATFYVMILVENGVLPVGSTFANGISFIPGGTNPGMYTNSTKPRVKIFTNLVEGKSYTLYCFSGNAHGVSVMSEGTTFTFSNH